MMRKLYIFINCVVKVYSLTIIIFSSTHLQVHSQTPISGIINDYTEVLAIDTCSAGITVSTTTGFNISDKVLIIQMQGAEINETNSASFGNINTLNSAGLYETGIISNISGNVIFLQYNLVNSYNISGKVQLVRIPQYTDANVIGDINSLPWNGSVGGIIMMEVANTLTLNADIDAGGQGFRGGAPTVISGNNCTWAVQNSAYFYDNTDWRGAYKGEGIAIPDSDKEFGKGAQANGGGGGNDHNAGGAGGANVNSGGKGGNNDEPATFGCSGLHPGAGGKPISTLGNRLFMGGGGGAGHGNNNLLTSGGNGGGIIIIQSQQLIANNHEIRSNGTTAINSIGDGTGGGGAGGTIVLLIPALSGNLTVSSHGGTGGNSGNINNNRCYGPGGGGSGGRLLTDLTGNPGMTTNLVGGSPGIRTNSTNPCNGTSGNALPGQDGSMGIAPTIPQGNTTFTFNINAIVVQPTCGFNNGSISISPIPGASYSWTGGLSGNNPVNVAPGTYTVTVTNNIGCIASDTAIVILEPSSGITALATPTATSCGLNNGSISVSPAGAIYNWTGGLSGSNPVNVPSGTYSVTVTSGGCSSATAVSVAASSGITALATPTATSCGLDNGSIIVSPAGAYNWTGGLSGSNPVNVPSGSYSVTVTSGGCSSATAVSVAASSGITAIATPTATSCGLDNGSIIVSPAGAYNWTGGLSGSNPVNVPPGFYSVTVTSGGCSSATVVSVAASSGITALATPTATSCGLNNGSISVSPAGAIYNWTGGLSGSNPVNVPSGSYSVTVTSGGCSSATAVSVAASSGITALATPTATSCGLNNGSISVSPAGAIYNWTGGLSGSNPVNVPSGTYSVTVTSGGCSSATTVSVAASSGITAIAIPTATSCGLDNGSIIVGPAGAMYNWTGGLSGSNPVNVTPGTYSVTVTALGGCTDETSVTINPSAGVTAIATPTQPTCGLNNGSIIVSPAGAIYNWTGGLSGSNPVNVSPGTYTVTVTAPGGCTDETTVTINPSAGVTVIATPTQPTCGLNNGSISVSPAGAIYNWTGGLSGSNPVNVTPGTYSVTVTAPGGCTDETTVTINPSAGVNAIATPTQPTCGLNNGSISVSPAGAIYNWTGGLSGSNPVNVTPGTYTVSVTAPGGCTDETTVTINPSAGVTAIATPTQPTCGLNNGSISVSPAGAIYNWTGGLSGSNPVNVTPGTYTVTVTAPGGCTDETTVTINPSAGVTAIATPTQPTCGLNNGSISVSPAGAIYNWTGGLSGSNPVNVTPGTYTVTVTAPGGCTDETTVTINPSAGVTAIATPTQPTCGLNNGSISVSPAGAIYNWTGGLSGSNPVNVTPGTYTVTVTAPGGCTDETTVTINPSAGVTVIATPTQPTCGLNNGSISVSPAGAIYNWTGGLSGSNPVNVTPGTYSVTVTAPGGCTDETTVTINPSAGVTVIATPTQPTCGLNNGSISVSPAGANYNWTGGLSGSNPINVAPGTYTVTLTAPGGCTDETSVTINPSAGVTAIATPTQPTCGLNNGSISVSPAGAIYNWTGGLSGSNPVNVTPGTYTVTVTAPGGCTDETTVTINPSAGVTAIATPTQPTCGLNNGSISVSPAGAIYNWTGGLSGSNPVNVSLGTYTVTVTAPGGCTDETTVTINPSAGVTAIATPTQPTCGLNNGSISVSPAGAIYNWTGGLSGSNPVNVTPGTYSVTVTAPGGCTDETTVIINPSAGVTAIATPTQPTCGLNNGSISVSPVGAIYNWTGGLSGSNPVNVTPGTYTVTVTAPGGCTDETTVTINPSTGVTAIATPTQPTCGLNNGSISVSPAGAIYNWTGGLSGSNPVNVTPGTYTVTVTAPGGCTDETTVTINPSTGVTAIATPTQPTCGLNNGSISVSPAGANYNWTGGLSGSNPVNVTPGTYTVTVTAPGGCTDETSVTINPSAGVTAIATPTQPTCGLNNGSISVSPVSAIYNWTGGLSGSNPVNVTPGTYSVTVTASGGCTDETTVTINPSAGVTAIATPTQPTCGLNNGSISVSPAGAIYNWTGGLSGSNPVNVAPGTYTLTVTAPGGCTDETSVTINPSAGVTAIATTTQPTCGLNNGSISVSPAGAIYNWTGGLSGSNPVNVAPGTYTVTVTTSDGCSATNIVTILPSLQVNADAGADQSICYGEIATFSASGGSNFSWSDGLDNQAIVNTQPLFNSSSFIVTVTEGVCIDTDTINVTVTQVTATILSSGDSVNFLQNNPIQLTAAGGDTYLWSHNLGQSNIVEVSPVETTIYSVTVTDLISGCSSIASINLIFNDLIKKYIIITPNNDGLNETFIIPDLADFPNSAMVIYNRWGSIVWNKQPYENDWHGQNMMEQELPEGTYYYVIKLNNVDGDIRRGSITIKR